MTGLFLAAWVWVSAGGTTCYAGDLDSVPGAYRGAAVEHQMGPLEEYARYTPVVSSDSGPGSVPESNEAEREAVPEPDLCRVVVSGTCQVIYEAPGP